MRRNQVSFRYKLLAVLFIATGPLWGQQPNATQIARGKYIVLLPDDDRVHPDGVEAAIDLMEQDSGIDLLVCGGMKHFVNQHISRPFYYGPGMRYGSRVEHAFTYGTCGNGFVIRRSTFAKAGLFPISAIAWAGGPTNVSPCCSHSIANVGLSLRKPQPGWSAEHRDCLAACTTRSMSR